MCSEIGSDSDNLEDLSVIVHVFSSGEAGTPHGQSNNAKRPAKSVTNVIEDSHEAVIEALHGGPKMTLGLHIHSPTLVSHRDVTL